MQCVFHNAVELRSIQNSQEKNASFLVNFRTEREREIST